VVTLGADGERVAEFAYYFQGERLVAQVRTVLQDKPTIFAKPVYLSF
jgi:hypothetical protein